MRWWCMYWISSIETQIHMTQLCTTVWWFPFSVQAYLAYGIPQNNTKRVFLLLKVRSLVSFSWRKFQFGFFIFLLYSLNQAAYNIGGHIVSADTIQYPILGCRMSRPGQVDPKQWCCFEAVFFFFPFIVLRWLPLGLKDLVLISIIYAYISRIDIFHEKKEAF